MLVEDGGADSSAVGINTGNQGCCAVFCFGRHDRSLAGLKAAPRGPQPAVWGT